MSNKNKRSQAQIEASRKNGARSKGPVSEQGKQASRRNALKHGLTAKFLKPQNDTRDQDQLYEQVHQELMNEYEPHGFTAQSTVSNLAHDYVQMIRCRQMIETLQQPSPLTGKDRASWEQLQATKQEQQSIASALALLTAGEDIEFPAEEAIRLAESVTQFVLGLEADGRKLDMDLLVPYSIDIAKKPSAGDNKADHTDEHEFIPEQELETLLEQWVYLKPVCRRLSDLDHLTAVFSGHAVPSPVVRPRLAKALQWIKRHLDLSIFGQRHLQRQADELRDQKLIQLANEPEQVMRLERYLRDIERSIERKMKQLSEG